MSVTLGATRCRGPRCTAAGCPWRGSYPLHDLPDDFDQALAALMRERPFVGAIPAEVTR